MASVYDEIRKTLETTLANIPNVPDIAWENVSFTPTTGTSYLKARLVPTIREPAHRGLDPQMYYQGIFLIDVYCPTGSGPSVADTLANTIIDTFDAPNDLIVGGVAVTIQFAERRLGTQEGAFYKLPVVISWYKYA